MDEKKAYRKLPNSDDHNCFACGPMNSAGLQMVFFTNDLSVVTWLTVPDHLCGWNNLVHGGVLSTILDEIMSWTAMYLLKSITMTRSITVDFLKPIYTGNRLKAEGNVLEVTRQRSAVLEGSIYNKEGQLCAKSTGSFALLTPALAKRMGIMDAVSLKWFESVINV